MLAKDLKPGMVINYQESPVILQTVSVQSPSARGAATLYKWKGRDVLKKQKINLTLKGTDNLDEADFERRPVKMMYTDQSHIHLLDDEDFNQYSLPLEDVENELNYLSPELEGVTALIYNDECVGMALPSSVELKITECDPGVKGNSATSRTKPATLETGYIVQVPEYMKEGEVIKVDTRTGDYLSRA